MSNKKNSYGEINFLSSDGKILGETLVYSTKEEFDKEVKASIDVGRPIISVKYKKVKSLHR